MSNNRILIYGSCVSRDPVDALVTSNSISIANYISKTSIISQCEEPLPLHPVPEGEDFASRMVRMDLYKDAYEKIRTGTFDYILIDFIDERLPLLEIDGALVTGSRFFFNAFPEYSRKRRVVDLYSQEGRDKFLLAMEKFCRLIRDLGIPEDRVILHRAWWARKVETNDQLQMFNEDELKEIHQNNEFLAFAYREFKRLLPGSASIEIDKNLIVSDAAHKWGRDPFHYVERYNSSFRRQLMEIIADKKDKSMRAPENDYQKPTHQQNLRLRAGISIYADSGDKRDPLITAYGLEVPYLTHTREYVAKFRDTGVEFDENGVPANNFRWGGPYRYSVTIGHHGLSCLSRFQATGDQEELRSAINVAQWLCNNQREDGSWAVEFEHNWFPPRCAPIRSPWTSAMGQGLCISLLSRIAHLAKLPNGNQLLNSVDRECLIDSARRALAPFEKPPQEGGVRALLFGTHVFYEEYPTQPHSFVLNGFIYSLLGLYDLWLATDDQVAHRLYTDGVSSLRQNIHFYDLGRATAYDLTHLTCIGYPPNLARASYHFIHVQLLSVLNLLEGGSFETILERWHLYLRGWGEKSN